MTDIHRHTPPAELTPTACDECVDGTVLPTRVLNYKTAFQGYPYIVPVAWIGICDKCRARQSTAQEHQRWKAHYEQHLAAAKALLDPAAIETLRGRLGLGKKEFAQLIGTTRQSVHAWGNAERTTPQGRGADLLLKLVFAALEADDGRVDVLGHLLAEAKKWGVELEIATAEAAG